MPKSVNRFYLGDAKIKKEIQEGDYIRIEFESSSDGEENKEPSILLSPEVLEAARTIEPSDSDILRTTRCDVVATEVMRIFVKHNIRIHPTTGDFHIISTRLTNMIENSIMAAEEKRWGGIHPYHMDLLSIHRELLEKE